MSYQPPEPILVVGVPQVTYLELARFLPAGSVIFVEEPDVVRNCGFDTAYASDPCVREVLPWEYQTEGAADTFFARHRSLRVAAVLPGVEYAVPFAARLAERYGLPGGGFGAAQVLRNKRLLRKVTSAAGVPNPASAVVANPAQVRDFLARHPGKAVLKPANRQGSVGTMVVTDPSEVDAAWADCLDQDEGPMVPGRGLPLEMLVEQFVEGPEYSVEMLVKDGSPILANVTRKTLFPGPYPLSRGHAVPSGAAPGLHDSLVASTRAVLDATGFGTGIVHCEWIAAEVPYLVECAGRWPGSAIGKLIGVAWDIDLYRSYVELMCGGEPVLPAEPRRAAAVRYLHAEPGEVVEVTGLDQALAHPAVLQAEVSVVPGDRVPAMRNLWHRVGFVTGVARDHAKAVRAVEELAATVTITTRAALR